MTVNGNSNLWKRTWLANQILWPLNIPEQFWNRKSNFAPCSTGKFGEVWPPWNLYMSPTHAQKLTPERFCHSFHSSPRWSLHFHCELPYYLEISGWIRNRSNSQYPALANCRNYLYEYQSPISKTAYVDHHFISDIREIFFPLTYTQTNSCEQRKKQNRNEWTK